MNKSSLALAIAVGVLAQQAGAAGFLEDSKLNLSSRTFYYENDNHAPSVTQNNQRETGEVLKLDYLSGFTQGVIGVGVDAQMLYGLHLDGGAGHHPATGNSFWPSEHDGTAQSDLARGDANVKFRYSKTELHVGGALAPQLPILLSNDSRAMPQNFDGGIITSKDIDNVTLVAGQLEHSTGRASTNSTGLSVAGAYNDSNQFRFAGGDWKVTKDLTLQYYHANLEDFYKQDFLGLVHVLPLGNDQSFKTDLRYFNSRSDGKNSSGTAGYAFNNNGGYADHAGEVDNNTWSTIFTYQLGGSSFLAGYQSVSDSGGFVLLNQGSVSNDGKTAGALNSEDNGGTSFYLFTDSTVNSFIRAGEQTKFAQYSYDFSRIGVPGLKASISYLKGDDIKSSIASSNRTFSEWERDARIDYVIQTGYLKGFGTTLRTGSYHVGGDTTVGNGSTRSTDQTRLIFNYTYAFF
ncbi:MULTISPECIES: OprD family outer membrane porin [unclassified Pseudomonas]|uniref:OprD family outer membrane porin n=1 Tax=unclassified Pseudomonas TaxID=196821 RepID=UPI002AC96E6A|nr:MULTISPECIES: OprD family outer membrane porin [unclassified Pseudomonas]MEB0043610.1 OprD family outer membrane porin [Pseudomonas sp. MH10]MEB0076862.1 OprD family outer membrane porin [Pseudomonas sp. MH10out]MEB0091824.1 OprD family outer membrane porin [Pseudomonas sp. CCI4.2]MEB0103277.1 OprD family outer membrane porin [Pseudomonas sp. CCI3.2]MEB0119241.1 OprD family outer membrane porin [Pseudomonas sp. CCI1.2]